MSTTSTVESNKINVSIPERRNTISGKSSELYKALNDSEKFCAKRRNTMSAIIDIPMLSIELIDATRVYIQIPKAPRSKDTLRKVSFSL